MSLSCRSKVLTTRKEPNLEEVSPDTSLKLACHSPETETPYQMSFLVHMGARVCSRKTEKTFFRAIIKQDHII